MNDRPRLPRRTFLKGVGASLGLPLLNAMCSSNGWAAGTSGSTGVPNRLAFVFVPNGVIVPDWTPKGEGSDWQLSPTLQPLASVKDRLCVMTGLAQDKVTVSNVYRCGVDTSFVTLVSACAGSYSTFVRVVLTDTYTPTWTKFGLGGAVNYSVTRQVQVS